MIFVLMDFDFEVLLDVVGEFHSGSGKQFHAIIVEGIMRSRDDHSGREIFLPNQAGDAGSADDAGGKELDSIIGKSGGELRGDVRPRFTRIHSDQDARPGVFRKQVFSERPRHPVQSGVVQGVRAGNTANAVCAEQFLGHLGVREAGALS